MDHQSTGSMDMTVPCVPRADSPLTGQYGPNEKDSSSVSQSPSLVNELIDGTWFWDEEAVVLFVFKPRQLIYFSNTIFHRTIVEWWIKGLSVCKHYKMVMMFQLNNTNFELEVDTKEYILILLLNLPMQH